MVKKSLAVDVVASVRELIDEAKLIQPGDKVLVGVSGGADSVALFLCFVELQKTMDFELVVAHLNHSLRGQDADEDECFVRELAAGYSVPVVTHKLEPGYLAATAGMSTQQAAREERFRFFNELYRSHGHNKVALGHHQDDQVETVLLNMVRGTGLAGLMGMQPRERGLYDLTIIRPLLRVGRASLERFLALRGQSYRQDASNTDAKYRRNFVRHKVMPLLTELNSDVHASLLRLSEHAAQSEDFITTEARGCWARAASETSFGTAVCVQTLRNTHPAIRARLLMMAMAQASDDSVRLETAHLEACLGLLTKQAGRQITLPGRMVALRTRGAVVFFKRASDSAEPYAITVHGPSMVSLPDGATLEIALVADQPSTYPQPSAPVAFMSNLNFPLQIRNRRPGDAYLPLGGVGRQSLKRAMSEAEIPLPWRDRLPVVESSGRIMWVPGLRVAEEARVLTIYDRPVYEFVYRNRS